MDLERRKFIKLLLKNSALLGLTGSPLLHTMIKPDNAMASDQGGQSFFWGTLLYALHTHHNYDLSNKRLVVEKVISSNKTPKIVQLTSNGIEVLKYAPSNHTPKIVELTEDRIEVLKFAASNNTPRIVELTSSRMEVLKYAPSNNTPKIVDVTPGGMEVKKY
ncbi:hypothetical protein KAJ77_11230, partial [bacterium]|nr:hypothetical protein [bacterium]